MFGFGKKQEAGPPENKDLAKLLQKMMRDPEKYQGDFYTAFLTGNVFLIGESGDPSEGEKTLQEGEKVRVMQWVDPNGQPFIPIFTSLDELKKSTKEMGDVNYISFSGYDALNLTQGQVPVAIDSSAEYCLYLLPPQIAQILNYFDSLRGGA